MSKDASPPGKHADVEQLADPLLAALDENPDPAGAPAPDVVSRVAAAYRRLGIEFVRRYHRLQVDVQPTTFDEPVLFVANHGFGGIFDLNLFAVAAAFDQLALDRPVIVLAHQMVWTLKLGALVEPLGARPAGSDSVREAFEAGCHVLVFPGGDVDAFKSWSHRNEIVFAGRSGFARLAIEMAVPIVPIVTAGAGESLLVVSKGERLARAMRLDKLLRLKALPVTVSLPWGVSIGGAGMLPYLPLPSKLHTRVLPAMLPEEAETGEQYAARVESAMQEALTEMTAGRWPLLG
jgi:1-acyl-sn-glycerol-3-phosphate acyltransferase